MLSAAWVLLSTTRSASFNMAVVLSGMGAGVIETFLFIRYLRVRESVRDTLYRFRTDVFGVEGIFWEHLAVVPLSVHSNAKMFDSRRDIIVYFMNMLYAWNTQSTGVFEDYCTRELFRTRHDSRQEIRNGFRVAMP